MIIAILQGLIRDKFRRYKELRARLLDTGHRDLVYENDHNDQFWGVCKVGTARGLGGKGACCSLRGDWLGWDPWSGG
jgi:predicted NAD-dependent protein-ADP-ribosyltransferase YbiA (DUF1768 family)